MLSGLASQLDPEINPWYQIERYGRQIIGMEDVQQLGRETLLHWLKRLTELPGRVDRALTTIEKGRLQVQTTADRATLHRLDRLEKQMARLQLVILGAAGLISGTLYIVFRRKEDD